MTEAQRAGLAAEREALLQRLLLERHGPPVRQREASLEWRTGPILPPVTAEEAAQHRRVLEEAVHSHRRRRDS